MMNIKFRFNAMMGLIALTVASCCIGASCAQNPPAVVNSEIKSADVSGTDTRPKLPVGNPPAGIKHVVIVSLDGGKPSVLRDSKMPSLMSYISGGAVDWDAQTTMPSVTLPSHSAMLSGLAPANHKVLWNSYEPEKGAITVPTIFNIARKSGYQTALIATKEKFVQLYTPDGPNFLEIIDDKASVVARYAGYYFNDYKPGVLFVHFLDPDSAGHQYGWGSDEQKESFAECDRGLKILHDAVKKAGVLDSTVFIISADHGGHGHGHGDRIPADMTIPWIAYGAHVKSGFTITQPVVTYDTAATALWLLGIKIPDNFDGQPVASAFE
jgi:predicted AlkP superfamily pyrophosphatase or phosphodiesterase